MRSKFGAHLVVCRLDVAPLPAYRQRGRVKRANQTLVLYFIGSAGTRKPSSPALFLSDAIFLRAIRFVWHSGNNHNPRSRGPEGAVSKAQAITFQRGSVSDPHATSGAPPAFFSLASPQDFRCPGFAAVAGPQRRLAPT